MKEKEKALDNKAKDIKIDAKIETEKKKKPVNKEGKLQVKMFIPEKDTVTKFEPVTDFSNLDSNDNKPTIKVPQKNVSKDNTEPKKNIKTDIKPSTNLNTKNEPASKAEKPKPNKVDNPTPVKSEPQKIAPVKKPIINEESKKEIVEIKQKDIKAEPQKIPVNEPIINNTYQALDDLNTKPEIINVKAEKIEDLAKSIDGLDDLIIKPIKNENKTPIIEKMAEEKPLDNENKAEAIQENKTELEKEIKNETIQKTEPITEPSKQEPVKEEYIMSSEDFYNKLYGKAELPKTEIKKEPISKFQLNKQKEIPKQEPQKTDNSKPSFKEIKEMDNLIEPKTNETLAIAEVKTETKTKKKKEKVKRDSTKFWVIFNFITNIVISVLILYSVNNDNFNLKTIIDFFKNLIK